MDTDNTQRAEASPDITDMLVDSLTAGYEVSGVNSESLSKKRKTPEEGASTSTNSGAPEISLPLTKKTKLAGNGGYADKSQLPAEIWHKIFTFCPPRTLADPVLTVWLVFGNSEFAAADPEMDLLLSTASTFLIPALQFIFITSDTRIVPLSIIERGLLPPATTLKKIFWTADVEKLREEFSAVRELGAPAVEEWQKGLITRGSTQRSDTSKYEKFSDSGGVASMRSFLYPGHKPQATTVSVPSAGENARVASPVGIASPKPNQDQLPNGTVSRTATKKVAADAAPTTPLRTKKIAPENILSTPLPTIPKKKTREEMDKELEEAQDLIQRQTLKYADEAISAWDGGNKVKKHNAPAFAADVLMHPADDGIVRDPPSTFSSFSHNTLPPRPPPVIGDTYDDVTRVQYRPSLTRVNSFSASQSYSEGNGSHMASWSDGEHAQRSFASSAAPERQSALLPLAAPARNESQSTLPPSGPRLASNGDAHLLAPKVSYAEERGQTIREIYRLWPTISKLRGVPGVTRLFALLYHANKFFKSKFGRQLPLTLFTQSLEDRQKMSDIRSIQELPCRACYLGLETTLDGGENMTMYSLPHLLVHFADVHLGSYDDSIRRPTQSLNWLKDMIIYPQPPALLNMVKTTKSTVAASKLLSEAVEHLLSGQDGGRQPIFNIYAARKQAAADRLKAGLPYESPPKKPSRTQEDTRKRVDRPITPTSQQSFSAKKGRTEATINLSEEQEKQTGTTQLASKQTIKLKEEALLPARETPLRHKAADAAEEKPGDLLGALEMHLKGEPTQKTVYKKLREREEVVAPAHNQGQAKPLEEFGRQPLRQESRGRANGDYDERVRPPYRRERSPVDHTERHRPVSLAPYEQFRERSPLRARQFVEETSFTSSRGEFDDTFGRGPRQVLPPYDSQHYGPPTNRQSYYEDYVDEGGRRAPSSQPYGYDRCEVYDIVRVADPEGDYYVRRPVRREHPQALHRELDRYDSPISSADGRTSLRRRTYGGDYQRSGYGSPHDSYAYGVRHEWDSELDNSARERNGDRGGRAPLAAHTRAGRGDEPMNHKYAPRSPRRGARMAD
ncbi:hypothetical protein SEPCBS119000_002900 [Sporothrix epigloea]|uniref:DUF7892 domain-containing protein n=1 Tax=Sporothrix epigloea TaxID=1892477 RepID=A0ABP0DLE5_9PEZI